MLNKVKNVKRISIAQLIYLLNERRVRWNNLDLTISQNQKGSGRISEETKEMKVKRVLLRDEIDLMEKELESRKNSKPATESRTWSGSPGSIKYLL